MIFSAAFCIIAWLVYTALFASFSTIDRITFDGEFRHLEGQVFHVPDLEKTYFLYLNIEVTSCLALSPKYLSV